MLGVIAQAIADRVADGRVPQFILHWDKLAGQSLLADVMCRLRVSGAARRSRNVIANVVDEARMLSAGVRPRDAAHRAVFVRVLDYGSKKRRSGHLWIIDRPWIKLSVLDAAEERALSVCVVLVDIREVAYGNGELATVDRAGLRVPRDFCIFNALVPSTDTEAGDW